MCAYVAPPALPIALGATDRASDTKTSRALQIQNLQLSIPASMRTKTVYSCEVGEVQSKLHEAQARKRRRRRRKESQM